MKLVQVSIVLSICRGVLCASDKPELPTPQPESGSVETACLQANSGQGSRLSGRVLRISGCVDTPPLPLAGPDDAGTSDHSTTPAYIVAVHDDDTICTGSLELERHEPQGQFMFDVSLSDNYFSWPVFVDVCRGLDFDSCRLIKVISPNVAQDAKYDTFAKDHENANHRRPIKAARLATSSSSSGNETSTTAVLYQVYVDLCNSSTSSSTDEKNRNKTPSLLYRKLSKNQPRRAKRQTSVLLDNVDTSAEEQMREPPAEWVRRIPAQFANNRRGPFSGDNAFVGHSPFEAPSVVRRKWKNGAAMQWIRKKSTDRVSADDDVINEENGVIDDDGDDDYPDERKRKWAKNGMGWIKRKWNKPGMGWLKRGEEEKRKWKSNAGMKWV